MSRGGSGCRGRRCDQGAEVGGDKEKALSFFDDDDDDDECTDNTNKEQAPNEYKDSDVLRSLDEDSDEEDEDDGVMDQSKRLNRKKNVERPVTPFDPNTKKKDIQFFVSMIISGPQEFGENVKGYFLGRGKDIGYIKNTGKWFQLKCKMQKCPWELWVSRMDETSDTLQVKTYQKNAAELLKIRRDQ